MGEWKARGQRSRAGGAAHEWIGNTEISWNRQRNRGGGGKLFLLEGQPVNYERLLTATD